MPELPEVEIVKRGLKNTLTGQKIQSIKRHRHNLRHNIPIALETALGNSRIINFVRRGKYILMELDNQFTVLFHLGMSGKLIVQPLNTRYEKQIHEHLTLITYEEYYLKFIDPRRFGIIDLFLTKKKHKLLINMGPEPLASDEKQSEKYCKELSDYLFKKFKNKKQFIKNVLLDQHIIAGLGNIYVCEALFLSKISPFRRALSLSFEEIYSLIQSIQTILLQAIKAGGSSMRDYVHVNGKRGYFQMQWNVYGKEGEYCTFCLKLNNINKIKRGIQAGRSSFYCDLCQK